VVDGCAPLTVNFQNTSTGSNLNYLWDFGNGNQSNQQNPGAIYIQDGTYSIKLKVWNSSGSDSITKTGYITVFAKPVANFGLLSPVIGCAPSVAKFKDSSTFGTYPIQTWLYDFGDGSVSGSKDPNHTYQNGGVYSVSLQITDTKGCSDVRNRTQYVKISDPFAVDFTVSNGIACSPPLTTSFNPIVSGGTAPYTYSWDFGDASTSATKNPSHTFTGSKIYTITLAVTDANGCTSSVSKAAVNTIGPKADFITNVTSGCAPLSVRFQDKSNPSPPTSTLSWTAGPFSSTSKDATFVFTQPGTYDVTWKTYSAGCGDTLVQKNKITVHPSPNIDFTASDSLICAATKTVNFYPSSTLGIQSWMWHFGNGDSSSSQFPQTTYYDTGKTYEVRLFVRSINGCEQEIIKPNWIQKKTTRANMAVDSLKGCFPYFSNFEGEAFALTPIVHWHWDFGNSDSVDGKSARYSYPDTGSYTASLTVTDQMGCVATASRLIRVGLKPKAAFGMDTSYGCSRGLEVQFENYSRDSSKVFIHGFEWHFEHPKLEGNHFQENPFITYHIHPGKYDVTLKVNNNGCEDSAVYKDTITVLGPYVEQIPRDPCEIENFWDTHHAFGGNKWYWEYNDGSPRDNNKDSVHHVFTQFPWHVDYNITDTITGCWDSLDYNGGILIPYNAWPERSLAHCAPAKISFVSNLLNVDSVLYEFSDGFITKDTSFSHTFDSAGVYWRKLTIYSKQGCIKEYFDSSYITLSSPVAKAILDEDTFCVPKTLKMINLSESQFGIKKARWLVVDYSDIMSLSDTTELYISTPPRFQGNGIKIVLYIEDDSGCVAQTDLRAHAFGPSPSLSFTQEPDCNTAKYRFKVENLGSVGLEPIKYLWKFPGGSSTYHEFLGSFPADVWNEVTFSATDPNGCVFRDTFSFYGKGTKIKTLFSADPVFSTCPPLLVSFKDTSLPGQDSLVSWEWDFGDGTGSLLQNPKKNYLVPGKYGVKLKVTDSKGCSSELRVPDIVIIEGPTGTFNFTPNEACESVLVNFTSNTQGATKIEWDLGDGNLGHDAQLSHTYTRPGRYIPLMILSNDMGCKYSLPPIDTIFVREAPIASFISSEACVGQMQTLISTSSSSEGKIIKSSWIWNNQLIGSGDSVHYTFNQPGKIPVGLIIESSYGCKDTLVQPIEVPGVELRLKALDSLACLGAEITLKADAVGQLDSVESYVWSFGDGVIVENTNSVMSHKYAQKGPYTAKLIVKTYRNCLDSASSRTLLVGDTVAPPTPFVHRVSIGKSMEYQSEFAPSEEVDFLSYHLEMKPEQGSFYEVAERFQRDDTLFVHPALNTLHESYYFRVRSENACGLLSFPTSSLVHRSIEVQASADTNLVDLNWNHYEGWPIAYYVIQKENKIGVFDSIAWVLPDSTHFRDTAVNCYDSPNYRIRAEHAPTEHLFSYSDTTKATPPFKPELPVQRLKRISVEEDKDILADWEKPIYSKFAITGYKVEYSKDGFVFYDATDWLDETARTHTKRSLMVDDQSYYFRLRMKDSCGDIGPAGPESRSILLKTTTDTMERPALNWSTYVGWEIPVHHYLVERIEPDGSIIALAETAASDSFYIDEITEDVGRPDYCYRITAFTQPGDYNALDQVWSHSNISCAPVRSRIFVANAFTPNSDNLNETFHVKGMYIFKYQIRIYTRWGEEIYQSDLFDLGWDGTYKGVPCQEDVYIYTIDAVGTDGQVYHLKGNITLLP